MYSGVRAGLHRQVHFIVSGQLEQKGDLLERLGKTEDDLVSKIRL